MATDTHWNFDGRVARYRHERTGRFLPARRIQQMRDELLTEGEERVDALAGKLASGALDVGEWEREMRDLVKLIFGIQYVFGRGGLAAMRGADWDQLSGLVSEQFGFLQGFVDDVAAGSLSVEAITARAQLYVGSSVQAHEMGKAAALTLDLPAYPGDGSSECRANDRCHWSLRKRADGRVEATWVASDDDRICPTCAQRAKDWKPLVVMPRLALVA